MTKARIQQLVLVATFLPLCWLGMMIVHEAELLLATVMVAELIWSTFGNFA